MNNKILLPQLTSMLASSSRLPKKQAEAFIKVLFSTLSDTLCRHENVRVKGFGTFKVNKVEARKSVNISTGAQLEIPAHYKLVFSPSKEMAERVNRDFSWLDIVEVADTISNEELNSVDIQDELPNDGHEDVSSGVSNEITEIETELDNNEYVSTSLPEKEEITISEGIKVDNEETEGEELGEKLEEEFGPIEPVEPFGPIDPNDPEPGQPLPEEKFITKEELVRILNERDTSRFVSKVDLAETKKAIKGIRRDINEVDLKRRKGIRRAVFISIFIAAALLCGGLFLVYYLLLDKINTRTDTVAEQVVNAEDNSDMADALVTDLIMEDSAALSTASPTHASKLQDAEKSKPTIQQKEETGTVVPTKPSDSKTYDTVTTTRYLTTISRQHYGNYHFWPYIYLENESILGHPDRIKPGTKVCVPDLAKYGVDPKKSSDITKAKKLGVEIYARFK